jgi:hypothetical protein
MILRPRPTLPPGPGPDHLFGTLLEGSVTRERCEKRENRDLHIRAGCARPVGQLVLDRTIWFSTWVDYGFPKKTSSVSDGLLVCLEGADLLMDWVFIFFNTFLPYSYNRTT